MSKNQKASGITNIINYDNSGNISFVSGSTTLMSVSSSGAVLLTGTMSGGVADSASLSANSNLLQGTGSIGFATTASLLAVSSSQQQISASLLTLTASYTALSSSYTALSGSYTTFSGSASTRVTQIENTYATTGSNSFRANQSITGSLVVSSTITAQTLVVQTVTSSIVYSSGSNIFGSALGDRQTFTGSIYQTGSIAAFAGSVGIGTTNPTYTIDVYGTGRFTGAINSVGVFSNGDSTAPAPNQFQVSGVTNINKQLLIGYNTTGNGFGSIQSIFQGTAYTPLSLNPLSGNVGIGTTSPNALLDAYMSQGGSTIAATHGTSGAYPKASGISFGSTSTGLSVSNNGSTTTFTGGAGIYASNGAASNNPTDLVFWTTSAGSPTVRLTISSTGAATFAGSATFGSDVFTYANGGIFFNGGGSYGSGIFQQSGGALALQTGTTPRLTIASTGPASFSNTLSLNSASNTAGSQGFLLFNYTAANAGSRSWKISTDQNDWGDFAIQQSTTQTGTTYANRLTINAAGAVSFAGSIGASSAGISSTSITTTASTTLSTSRGIIVDAATTTNSAFIPIGFSWASSISNYNPTWGMGLKTINYNAGTADLVFYTNDTVRMTINNGGAVTVNSNISANNINTFSLVLQGLSTPVSTGLGINAGSGGRTYLLLTSQQWDAGSSTSSRVWMIWCGYDGNNFSATLISSAGGSSVETWSQSGGILYVTGNTNFQMDITVISNG